MGELKGREGGCLCGAVRYRLAEEPMYLQACHCTDCQTISGGAFIINMWCVESEVRFSGEEMVAWENVAGSGKGNEIFACPKCGTDIASKYEASTGRDIMVRAGTLDDARDIDPMTHIFVRSKQDWVRLPDDKPVFDAFYNLFEHWPEHSAERFRRLMKETRGD